MVIEIGREDLFKEKLLSGINLFTGAGFSCLSNEVGKRDFTPSDDHEPVRTTAVHV